MTRPPWSAWALPFIPNTVGSVGLCLCAAATPPRDDRTRRPATLVHHSGTCDGAERAVYGASFAR